MKISSVIGSFARNVLPPKIYFKFYRFIRRTRLQVGARSFVHDTVQIIGQSNVVIGRNVVIGESGWFNVNHREAGKSAILIGDNCFLGRRSFLSSGDKIQFGEYCLTAADCRFLGSSHEISDPSTPYVTTGTTRGDSIVIGHNVFFGCGAVVLGNVTIGSGCVIGAGALILEDVPPFSMVVGNPGKVVQRYSFSKMAWIPIGILCPSDLDENPSDDTFLAMLRRTGGTPGLPIIAAGSDMGNL
ncbi:MULTISPECIES: DapH/DapD/GlmU-related protein [Paraburkholderia]|uniref:Acyltransferase n=1 Tax=Paraburkholderia madseniana TaxID=2599607 RepID=A0AAP5BJJ7_9BURK|nr:MULTISPECIES: acyltransferase [Paraburkholderia]MCX4149422.1 acyltransferase [Paraburkholderia madseniana]MDN7152357.1 acyltransferase [Paraburkholderia sp. WS6]MDQ6411239.1 acyltransferase [Paraburkholderia madseniana]